MKKDTLLTVVVLITIAGILGITLWYLTTSQEKPLSIAQEVSTPSCSVVFENLSPLQTIALPYTLSVIVDNRCEGTKWTVFEAQAGVIELYDNENNKVGLALLTTDQEWMHAGPTTFSATLALDQIPVSNELTLILTEDDPSGEKIPQQKIIPFFIQ